MIRIVIRIEVTYKMVIYKTSVGYKAILHNIYICNIAVRKKIKYILILFKHYFSCIEFHDIQKQPLS